MLTPRGMSLLLGAGALWGVGRFLGIAELYVVAAASAALVITSVAAVRLATATISVRRSVAADRILHGAGSEAILELRNDARLPAALLLVEDAVHHTLASTPRFVVSGLGPGRTAVLRYQLTGRSRGRYPVGPLRVRVRDPFSLAQRVRRYRGTSEVVVYPRVEPLPSSVNAGAHRGSGASSARRLFNTGDEFYTMREYVFGDDLRQVHWPSTAHRQRLMVRQQEQAWQAEATIVCDTRVRGHRDIGPDSALEKAVSIAASLVWHLADEGYALRLVTETDQRPPESQPWNVLLERLAEVEPSRVASMAPVLRRLRSGGGEGLLAAVVAAPPENGPVARDPELRALMQAGRSFTGRLALVVDSSGGRDGRAAEAAAVLRAGGWRATSVTPGQPLADRWRLLSSSPARATTAAAYQPGPGAATPAPA